MKPGSGIFVSHEKRNVYDDVAGRYDAAMRPLERWFLSRLRKQVFSNLPSKGRVLELGAGTGANFCYYSDDVTGAATEPSGEMLNIARTKARPDQLQLVQSRAEHLPFGQNTFDAALATLVLCSVESVDQAFGELRRVVKPGGRLVLLDHVRPGGVLGPVFDILNLITSALLADHFNRRTAQAAQAAGFEVIRLERRMLGVINLIVCRCDK